MLCFLVHYCTCGSPWPKVTNGYDCPQNYFFHLNFFTMSNFCCPKCCPEGYYFDGKMCQKTETCNNHCNCPLKDIVCLGKISKRNKYLKQRLCCEIAVCIRLQNLGFAGIIDCLLNLQ